MRLTQGIFGSCLAKTTGNKRTKERGKQWNQKFVGRFSFVVCNVFYTKKEPIMLNTNRIYSFINDNLLHKPPFQASSPVPRIRWWSKVQLKVNIIDQRFGNWLISVSKNSHKYCSIFVRRDNSTKLLTINISLNKEIKTVTMFEYLVFIRIDLYDFISPSSR